MDTIGVEVCSACAVGYYKELYTLDACTPCPENTTTYTTANVRRADCQIKSGAFTDVINTWLSAEKCLLYETLHVYTCTNWVELANELLKQVVALYVVNDVTYTACPQA